MIKKLSNVIRIKIWARIRFTILAMFITLICQSVVLSDNQNREYPIIFSSDREGNYQIFKMDFSGKKVIRLTNNNATEMSPRWSPDGGKIAFVSDRNGPFRIFIMDEDGSNQKEIPNTDPTPGDINAGVSLDWSPDSNQIVFTNIDHTAIRIVNVDGSGLRIIIKGKIGRGYSYYHGVSWKQRDFILFNVQNPDWGYYQDIFAINPKTGKLTQVTDEWGEYAHCVAPDLSPDGTKIVVVRQPYKDPPPRNIFIMDVNGKNLVNLTGWNWIDATPRWSPDGRRIVFCSGTLGKKRIWIMNSDGGECQQLTKSDSDDIQPDIRWITEPKEEKKAEIPTFGEELLRIPQTKMVNPDAVAVVIGVRDYKNPDVPAVEYALNDAQLMKEYLIKALGYREGNVIYLENPTQGDLSRVFGTRDNHKGQLFNYLKPGKSDVFIYYSGHGAPDVETKEAYFVPSDCHPNYVKLNGYPLDLFYENLAKIPAKSVTVVLEACFSGASEKGMLIARASGITIVPVMKTVSPNTVVMTSSSGDEISSWYPEKRHGLFTYFFLKGLAGEADKNKDKQITTGELKEYINENVPYLARREHARTQTPTFKGDENRVVVKY